MNKLTLLSFLFLFALSETALGRGTHDFYQTDDAKVKVIADSLAGFQKIKTSSSCQADLATIQQGLEPITRDVGQSAWEKWQDAKSNHQAEEETNDAMFQSGLGGHPRTFPMSSSRDRPASDNTTSGKVAAIAGAITGSLQELSMLCRGHKLNEKPNPDSEPKIRTIRTYGKAAVAEFERRKKVAMEVKKDIGNVKLDFDETSRMVLQGVREDKCKQTLQPIFSSAKDKIEQIQTQLDNIAQMWDGQKRAYEEMVNTANRTAVVCDRR